MKRNNVSQKINHFYIENIVNFAYWTDFDLYPYQSLWIEGIEHNSASLILASRRAGKSFGIAFGLIYLAIKYPKTKINIFCPAISQAKRSLEYIKDIVINNKILHSFIDNRYNKGITTTKLNFLNQSRFECFGLRSKIDSADSNVAYIDEYADCDLNIVNERILPTLASKKKNGLGNKIIYSGVPKFIDDNIHRIIQGENQKIKVLPIIDYKKAIEFDALDKNTIDMIKDSITEDEFIRAFECSWTSDQYTLFDNKTLQLNYSRLNYSIEDLSEFEIGKSYFGFDVSGRGTTNISQYAVVILSKVNNKEIILSHYQIWDGNYNVDKLIDELETIWKKYNCKSGLFDDFGFQMMLRLQKKLFNKSDEKELPLQSMKFQGLAKHNMFQNGKLMIEKKNIMLPVPDKASNELFRQLGNIRIEPTKTTYFSYVKKNNKIPDDIVDAFVLAAFCAKEEVLTNSGSGWGGCFLY